MTFALGVVGLGVMGKNHARVATELDGVELAAICDADPDVLAQQEARFETPAFRDVADLLAVEGLDAVVVATPTKTHPAVARQVVDAGVHLLVEKPLADNAEDARGIADAADEAGLTLAVGHIERHNPVVGTVATALGDGRFGDLIALSARRVSNLPGRIRDVGVVLDLGVHDIDVMRYLVGEPVTAVYARAGTHHADHGHLDHAHVMLEFADGVTGTLEANWLTPMKVRTLSLTCSGAYVELDYIDQAATVSTSRFGDVEEADLSRVPLDVEARPLEVETDEPLRREIDDLRRAVEEGRPPLVTGADGVAAIRIAEAAHRSARDGTVVTLDEGAG